MFAITAALDQPTPMLCLVEKWQKLNHVLTSMEDDKHLKQTSFDGTSTYVHRYAVWRSHWGEKPTCWHTSSRSTVGPSNTMHINAGRFPSTRICVGRVNEQVCNHGGWTTHSNAVPMSTTQVDRPTHHELNITNGQIMHRFAPPSSVATTSSKVRTNTANLVHPRAPMAESLDHSCHNSVGCLTFNMYANRLNMLEVMARPTTPMRCPVEDLETSNHALIRTEKPKTNTSDQNTAQRGMHTTNQMEHNGGKNPRLWTKTNLAAHILAMEKSPDIVHKCYCG